MYGDFEPEQFPISGVIAKLEAEIMIPFREKNMRNVLNLMSLKKYTPKNFGKNFGHCIFLTLLFRLPKVVSKRELSIHWYSIHYIMDE